LLFQHIKYKKVFTSYMVGSYQEDRHSRTDRAKMLVRLHLSQHGGVRPMIPALQGGINRKFTFWGKMRDPI
jgi:hypothetical protein